jgi:hypothetical protein
MADDRSFVEPIKRQEFRANRRCGALLGDMH